VRRRTLVLALETENYLDLRLDAFLGRLAAGDEAPGGGSAAALTVAFAAGLVAMVARGSHDSWEEAAGVAAQALAIQDRAAPLARIDAEAWQDALAALRDAGSVDGDGARRNFALEQKLERAAAVPLEIAELGADAAALAALAGELGDGAFRADAAAAAALAAGGARAAAHLVEVNLGMREGDEGLARARASEKAAAEAAERLLESIR
jgi:formiminotetrahydrofolate cyclodeaminase